MKTETLLRGGLAMSLLTCTILMFFFAEGERKLDDTQIKLKLTQDTLSIERSLSDSLHDELFNANVEIGRHEITREEILKPNKELYKRYKEYYLHQTE
jgi:hypothetical protein